MVTYVLFIIIHPQIFLGASPSPTMVWGVKKGVDDLIANLEANATDKTMLVMKTRQFEGNDFERFCDALSRNTSLEQLICSGHRISNENVQQFARAINVNSTLKSFCIGSPEFTDADGASLFCDWRNHSIEEVDLECRNLGVKTMESISNAFEYPNNSIQILNLNRNRINDRALKLLAGCISKSATLQHLALKSNLIGAEGTKALGCAIRASCGDLDFTLLLDYNEHMGGEGFRLLLSDTSTNELATTTPNNDCINHEKSLRIVYLSVKHCNIGSHGANSLGQLHHRSPWAYLRTLNLSSNWIDENGLEFLESLLAYGVLESLDLSHNAIKTTGLATIGVALHSQQMKNDSSSLKKLFVSSNSIEYTPELESAMKYLCLIKSLDILQLRGNSLGDQGAICILQCMTEISYVKTLGLAAIHLSDYGCSQILDILPQISNLKVLEIAGNKLSDTSRSLVDAFPTKSSGLDIIYGSQAEDDDVTCSS